MDGLTWVFSEELSDKVIHLDMKGGQAAGLRDWIRFSAATIVDLEGPTQRQKPGFAEIQWVRLRLDNGRL